MRRETSLVRPTGCHDNPNGDRRRIQAALLRNGTRKTASFVGRSDQVVDIDDVRLEFDDQQRSLARVPGEDVDYAAFAVDRVRDFWREDPVRNDLAEPARNELMQVRMPPIQETVQVPGSPTGNQVNPDVELAGDILDGRDRQRANMPTLDPADRRLGHARSRTELLLRPAPPLTDQTDRTPEAAFMHSPTMTDSAYRALM